MTNDNDYNGDLHGAVDVQQRSRWALLLTIIVCGAILAGEWNAYFSWDRQWTGSRPRPHDWAQEQALAAEIKSWVDTNSVGVGILGLRLSIADAAMTGSVALLIATYYLCMCIRRENEEVGSILVRMRTAPRKVRRRVLRRLQSAMIFSGSLEPYAPFADLKGRRGRPANIPFSDLVLRTLIFLPVMTIASVLFSDVWFAFVDYSPQRHNLGAAWFDLSFETTIQLVAMDAFCLLMGVLIASFCRTTWRYSRYTDGIVREFEKELAIGNYGDELPASA